MTEASLHVASGAIVALRLYDVAYAIDLARVESLAAARAEEAVGRLRLTRTEAKAIALPHPPVEIGLGPVDLHAGGRPLAAEAVARVYDFGAISITIRHPVEDVSWDAFVERSVELARAAADGREGVWRELLERVCTWAGPALERPSSSGLEEEYLVSIVERFDRSVVPETLVQSEDVVRLLTGERKELSAAARRDLLKYTFSYYRDDVAVLSWDQAFLIQPDFDRDVADILEVATAQLLELRYYDELLDRELPRMYDRVQAAHRRLGVLARGRYSRLAHELHVLVAEVTEITERIDNALKVTEDVYLARIYGAALELFRVPSWAAAVDRKLDIIRQTYTALHDEANAARAELLELGILLLIVLEIVLAFLL
jgi:hypothetical protein